MGRIIFLALVVMAVWLGWRLWRASLTRTQQNSVPNASSHEVLVECRHCGVRLPKSTALVQRENNTPGQAPQEAYFCSAQHRDEHNHRNAS